MKRFICAAVVMVGLGGGVAAAAPPPSEPPAAPQAAPPTDEVEPLTAEQIYGIGPSGSGPEAPDCAPLTVLGEDLTCIPAATPTPPGTIALAINAPCPVTGDLEEAFTEPSQMKTLTECMLPIAVAWLTWEYNSLTPPAEWNAVSTSLLPNNFLYVPTDVRNPAYCGYDGSSEGTLFYCQVDDAIYLGEAAMWNFYTKHGDASLFGAIAHEMGHRVQHLAGTKFNDPDNPNEGIPSENQADCFAGAFMAYAARNHYMDPLGADIINPDDVYDMINGFLDIGERLDEHQTHGTVDQRLRALYIGYNSEPAVGAWACDFYLTDIRIAPAGNMPGQSPTTTQPAS